MKRSVMISVGVATIVIAGLAGGGWYWVQAGQSPEAVRSEGGSVPIGGTQNSGGTIAMNAQSVDTNVKDGAKSSQLSSNSSQGAVNRATTNTPVPSMRPGSLPGPAEFGIYKQYKDAKNALFMDIAGGTGAQVVAGSQLKVNYRGWLTNGQMFDQSYGKQPFGLTEGAHAVISGWEQGLYGMKAGGKRRLIIPPVFGYGSQDTGSIPANSVLVFDIDLLEVN